MQASSNYPKFWRGFLIIAQYYSLNANFICIVHLYIYICIK